MSPLFRVNFVYHSHWYIKLTLNKNENEKFNRKN